MNDNEQWKVIDGWNKVQADGTMKYSVSSWGRVRVNAYTDASGKYHEAHLLQPQKSGSGSLFITLYNGHKNTCTTSIHLLVAQAFIDNPKNMKSVVHLDGDYTNNRVENLEWGTRQDKLKKKQGYVAKPTKAIRQYTLAGEFIREFPSIRDAADTVGNTSISHIRCCCSGRRRDSAYGFQWRYADDQSIPESNTLPPCHAERWKPVKQYTRDGVFVAEFSSSSEAAAVTGFKCDGIYKCCLGWRKWYSGYVWRFSDEAFVSRR